MICPAPECGATFQPRRPEQRYCSPKCRAAASRVRREEGIPGRIVSGPRRTRDGWSYTVRLESPPFDLGDQVRIRPEPEGGPE